MERNRTNRRCVKGYTWIVTVLMLLLYFTIITPFSVFEVRAGGVSTSEHHTCYDENVISITMDFSAPSVSKIMIQGKRYDRISIEGLINSGNPGEPVLPVKTAKLLIPFDKEIASTTVEADAEIVFDGDYVIEPGQRHIPIMRPDKNPENQELNKNIYGSKRIFPQEAYKFITLQKLSGYKIAIFTLSPVQYIPVERRVSYYASLTLMVKLRPIEGVQHPLRSRLGCNQTNQSLVDRVKRYIDNPDNSMALNSYFVPHLLARTLPGTLSGPGHYDYLLITDQKFVQAFQPLIDAKIDRGVSAKIVTTQWIYDNFDGTKPDGGIDCQTKIRNFIRSAHNEWGAQYVLLGGDADAEDAGNENGDDIVPCRILFDTIYSENCPDEAHIASDLYYACLDGTYDYNQNGIYGETGDGEGGGEVDLLAEVYVGRAPVDSVTEVNNFVNKTLAHERANPQVWKNKMVGEDLGWEGISRYALSCLEQIRLGSKMHGYRTKGIESSSIQNHVLYDANDYIWEPQTLIDSMNNSGTHYYNHLGHSNVTHTMKLTNDDVDRLSNTTPFFIYSQGCYAASFDNRDIAATSPQDSIGEHFVAEKHGAFAYIGNTRYGWGVSRSTDGASQRFHRYFWDAIVARDIKELGRANQQSKEDTIGQIDEYSPTRWCYFQITLLGDPETAIGRFPDASGKLPFPVNVIATEESYNNEVKIIWCNSSDAQGYLVFRSESYDSENALLITSFANTSNDPYISFLDKTSLPDTHYYYWVQSYNADQESGLSKPSIVYIHLPPVANAGEDFTTSVSSEDEKVKITLDGSASYDPFGESLRYEWQLDGNVIASEPQAAISLKAGTRTFTLIVFTDMKWNSDTVTVTVEVHKPNNSNNSGIIIWDIYYALYSQYPWLNYWEHRPTGWNLYPFNDLIGRFYGAGCSAIHYLNYLNTPLVFFYFGFPYSFSCQATHFFYQDTARDIRTLLAPFWYTSYADTCNCFFMHNVG